MNIIDARMNHEKSSSLLDLIRAYGWSQSDIDRQAAVVAERKAALDVAEKEWAA